jgi:nickel-dependent lactate racemase
MKTIKIIILLATISLFTSVPYHAAKARDCSDPKKFHEKMMCTITGDSVSSDTSDKPKKKGNGFWQKIKNFGGKNIGEAG